MKHRPFFFGLLVFLFLLPLQGEGVKVVIVHTSDAHGHIGPQPYPVSHRPAPVLLGGYPSLKTFLHQTKLNTYKEGGLPIWLDSGDFFQGTPIVSKTKGSCMVDFLNALSLVTTTLGNHDFDYGYVNLKKQFSRANFPVVDCNIFEAASGRLIPWAKPYIIIPFKGVKIGIIGITTPETVSMSFEENVKELEFKDPVPILNRMIPILQNRGVDLIVLLSHMGIEEDRVLASKVPGVDIILGGHSHNSMKRIEWNAENHTAIVHPGSENRSLSKIEIQIEHGKEPQINFEPITLWLEKYPEDPKIKVMVDQLLEKDKASLNQIIGYSDFDLNRGITGGDSPEGSFVADSMREFSRSDFAFINAGGIRHPIRKGPITMEDLYLLQPFDNQAEVLQLSGEQIRALIEMSLSVEFKQINKDDDAYHLDNFKVRAKGLKRVFQGKFGYLIPSGLHFEFDPQLPPMNRISVLSDSKGSALIPKNLYKVAVASYMSRGGDGYTFLKEIKPILTTPNYIRDMVLEKIIKDGGIKKLPETRILNKRLEVSFLD